MQLFNLLSKSPKKLDQNGFIPMMICIIAIIIAIIIFAYLRVSKMQ